MGVFGKPGQLVGHIYDDIGEKTMSRKQSIKNWQ